MATEDGIVYKLAYHAGKHSLTRMYFDPLLPHQVREEAEMMARECAASEWGRQTIINAYIAGYGVAPSEEVQA